VHAVVGARAPRGHAQPLPGERVPNYCRLLCAVATHLGRPGHIGEPLGKQISHRGGLGCIGGVGEGKDISGRLPRGHGGRLGLDGEPQ